MEPLIQLLKILDLSLIGYAVTPSLVMAILASRRLEQSSSLSTGLSRYLYAWSTIVLNTSLVWGICLASIGLIAMTLNMTDDAEKLGDSVTIVFSVVVCTGLMTAIAHVLEKKKEQPQLRLNMLDLVIMSCLIVFIFWQLISSTRIMFITNYLHPVLWPTQFALTGALFISGLATKKPWQSALFEANLGVTLFLMALGITAWFLDWRNFTDSRDSIWLISAVLLWGTLWHVSFYLLVLMSPKQPDANLKIKTWHFTEAFAFYAFLVYAPIGTTEYFRESADQKALQEQHEDQQSEIEYLKAELEELKKQISN